VASCPAAGPQALQAPPVICVYAQRAAARQQGVSQEPLPEGRGAPEGRADAREDAPQSGQEAPDAEEEVVDNDTVDDESPRKEDIVKQQPDFDCDPILEDAFTCSNCKHKFKTKNRFEHHKNLCSTSTSPLRPRFKQSQSLNPRLEMMAEIERGLSLSLERELCRQCCRNNYKEASLESHLRKCKGNYHKNFKIPCPFCKNPKRVFQTDSMLKSHMTAVHNNSSSMEKWRQIQKKRLEAQNKEYLRKSEKS